ncbi:hypothetical protein TWF694_003460 [Orbilia ellipsospora]|uniref:Uncharacterized protein n=1 Tax=Orbilia ellipsospora TaxID=2528407 RepID=A0AAV9WZH9_9PEZI
MSAPLTSSSFPSTPSASRSPSPSSPSLQKVRIHSTPTDSHPSSSSSSSSTTPNPSWRRSHIRSKSSSSVSPPPSMIRAHSLPLPNRGFLKTQGPPPSPKWTTTPASPTYRNSFVPTFPSPTSINIPALNNKRPSFLRTATPPPPAPPRMPPPYLATEVFPGSLPSSGQSSSYPPSLTSNASSPTSSRSCSPSLTTYSLETIEDSPDGELLAILEEEEERQQRESEKEKEADSVGLGLSLVTSSMNNMSLREQKRRQRWSVCGAERRSDFYLETITED